MSECTINVNGRFMTRRVTGVDRFAGQLLRAWIDLGNGERNVRAYVPSRARIQQEQPVQLFQAGRLIGHSWEQLELPVAVNGSALINLCGTGPLAYRRQLTVLHDANIMANPWVFSFAFRTWYRILFKSFMKRSAAIATVSKFSASELSKYFGVRASGMEVIYESGEHILHTAADPSIISKLGLSNQQYILAVGSRSANKNFPGVVRAASQLEGKNVKVVFAGGSDSRVFAGEPLNGTNLVFAGYVTDSELRALYERATCFVYPSFYEGFGLPPLEAMHCGCPAIVSNGSSLPEVCGGAALYCDPNDPADIAKQVIQILVSPSLGAALRCAGFERVRGFTWKKSAEAFQSILESYQLCQ